MKKRTIALLFAAAFIALLMIGCKPRDNNPQARPDAQGVESQTTRDSAKELHESKSDDEAAINDAAQALGRATSQFVDVFAEDEENDSVVTDGDEPVKEGALEPDSIDMSLVDDEIKRKYSDDRSLIAPTLSERSDEAGTAPKYRLEYKFVPNTNLAWNVVHLVRKRVSYGGVEKLIETSSTTERRWEFQDATSDGKVRARHWIDRMILQQNEEGKDSIDYDSERDVVVPKEISAFGTEKAVGVVLETFAIDPLGVMSDKKKLIAEYQGREGDSSVMVPFPDSEIAAGDVWTIPYTLYLKGRDNIPHPCKIVERFRLEKIDDKYATISFKTTLVSIVDDPVVQGALAERLFSGKVLFDRELGQALRTEMNFQKSVPEAYGFASFLEYNCQVVEKLDREKTGTPSLSENVATQTVTEQTDSMSGGETGEPAEVPDSSE
ncbi:MAG: hypothetical protein IJL92_05360 [Thermoguttaceae bacterium]|nr:hypothetical protein [Thermoguttaceae bacterium]